MKYRLVVLTVVGLLVLGGVQSSPARADNKTQAIQLYHQGKKSYKKGKYADAVVYFKRALRLRSHKLILFNIALCYAMLKKQVQAATFARRYLKEAKGKERNLPRVLRSAMSAVSVVLVRAPDPEAEIYLDGTLVGRGRVDRVVLPGQRLVEIRRDGEVVAKRTLHATAGRDVLWEISSLPRPRRVVPGSGEGGSKDPKDTAKGRGVHWAWFTTLAVVAVGLAAGAGAMSWKTKQAHDDFLANRSDGSLREDGLRFETTANVLWGVAGAAAVTAVVLAIFTRWGSGKKERAKALRIAPTLGPGSAGLTLTWSH